MTDKKICELIRKIYNCEFSESETDYWLDILERETGLINFTDYIYWPNLVGLDLNSSVDEITNKILYDSKSKKAYNSNEIGGI